MSYPHKCVRCGYCCLTELCPIASHLYGVIDRCPMLIFDGDIARCGLAGIVPIGDGCCMSARCFHGDEVWDFAALPKQTKRDLAQRLLAEKGAR
jgi:hypothetical protein